MQRFISLVVLPVLAACATVTAEPDQDIAVATTPPGAACSLQNNEGTWTTTTTPATVRVKRSFSTLTIYCSHAEAGDGEMALSPKTRGRAWGNLLMLGLPATVDAATGAGYEYDPSTVTIPLDAKTPSPTDMQDGERGPAAQH